MIKWDTEKYPISGNKQAIDSTCGKFSVVKSLDKKTQPYRALFGPGKAWQNKGDFNSAKQAMDHLEAFA